jgi:hypothetical protein
MAVKKFRSALKMLGFGVTALFLLRSTLSFKQPIYVGIRNT